MKKFQLRIFSVSLIVLLIITTAGLVAGAWFLKDWEDKVTKKFEGRKWDFASKIYSDTYHLYVGINLRLDDLTEKLRRLGYYESSAPPKTQGAYHINAGEGSVDIFLHDFDFPTEKIKGYPVRISLQGNTVARIEVLPSKTEKFDLELEPEVVTGLYQRIWQERRVVKLGEVPPLLVKSILAI
ncbi:MAG TPA: hypothetical protein VMZ02_11210, partial [Candidatus Limnocylindrales bacterium]|nr:hypothetical protein [Candidatus Limnocylindrales bacterium]